MVFHHNYELGARFIAILKVEQVAPHLVRGPNELLIEMGLPPWSTCVCRVQIHFDACALSAEIAGIAY